MKLEIKSFIIGILFTMNIFLIYGFSSIVHDNDHTHDSGDIEHSDYGYGGYGSLKAKIDDLEDEMDDYFEESHTHSSLEDKVQELEDEIFYIKTGRMIIR